MTQFTLEAKTQIVTNAGRFPTGTSVTIKLPAPAMSNTFLTNPNFRNSIIAQFRNQGIDIAPNQLGYGYWKVTDNQR